MKTNAQILREAKAIITNPANWTQREYARAGDGVCVSVEASHACKFCAVGAVARAANKRIKEVEDEVFQPMALLAEACDQLYHRRAVHRVNDESSHANVMAMYDRAIELAEKSA